MACQQLALRCAVQHSLVIPRLTQNEDRSSFVDLACRSPCSTHRRRPRLCHCAGRAQLSRCAHPTARCPERALRQTCCRGCSAQRRHRISLRFTTVAGIKGQHRHNLRWAGTIRTDACRSWFKARAGKMVRMHIPGLPLTFRAHPHEHHWRVLSAREPGALREAGSRAAVPEADAAVAAA